MILCKLYQWLWSCAYDSGKEPSAVVQMHISGCDVCRGEIEAMQTVDASVGRTVESPSEEWLQRVMQDVRRVPPPLPAPGHSAGHVWKIAGAGAAAVIFLVFMHVGDSKGKVSVPDDAAASEDVVPLAELAFSLENESAALENDFKEVARMATRCLPF